MRDSVVYVVAGGHRDASWWTAHRGKPVADLEGRPVVFFVIILGFVTVEAGSKVDCRVISYAWDWILGSRPLIGRNWVLEMSWALYI